MGSRTALQASKADQQLLSLPGRVRPGIGLEPDVLCASKSSDGAGGRDSCVELAVRLTRGPQSQAAGSSPPTAMRSTAEPSPPDLHDLASDTP